jgi:hypothetical protein
MPIGGGVSMACLLGNPRLIGSPNFPYPPFSISLCIAAQLAEFLEMEIPAQVEKISPADWKVLVSI